jgi:hypothetical protein
MVLFSCATIVSLICTSILTGNRVAAASVVSVPGEISDLLIDYSQYLESGETYQAAYYSPAIVDLIPERQRYYKEFYAKGIHARLIDLDSHFRIDENVEVIQIDDHYMVHVYEEIGMYGEPITTSPDDYPLIQAARWAIGHTNNAAVRNYLNQYIQSMTQGVKESVANGVEIVFVIAHDIEILRGKYYVRIIKDAFSDKSSDNKEGFDNMDWTENGFVRRRPAWSQLLDYEIYHVPVEALGRKLLKDFETITRPRRSDPAASNHIYWTTREKAVWYIQEYASNSAYMPAVYCDPYPIVLQDTAYYNRDYSAVWTQTRCNDCASFVSQALHYAGFPTDASWYPDINSVPWVQTNALFDYFAGHLDAGEVVYNLASTQPGDLAFILNQHVAMISAVNPHRYSAHTNDRLNYSFSHDFNIFTLVKYSKRVNAQSLRGR